MRKVDACSRESHQGRLREGGWNRSECHCRYRTGAVATKHPRTRYAVGKYVKQMILIRSWFGDRMFDRMVMNQMR
uniref:Uncharacterized protein n=1 Tax=Ralstonia solanacearum TaxID=305 RepID=A0A8D5EW15_RALSL|nr:hypothetical protein 23 [Ralstonia solanacearum]BCI56334.1 hypothetical protein 23 [Ralstonia solanacearum]BCI56368.1 hypothetical protein 19 [Ralstonia solanacearum]